MTKRSGEKMTIDRLAAVIQREFSELRAEVATKDELRRMEQKMMRGFEELANSLQRLSGTVDKLIREKEMMAVEVSVLEKRVARLERKVELMK